MEESMSKGVAVLYAVVSLSLAGFAWRVMLLPLTYVHHPRDGVSSIVATVMLFLLGAYCWAQFCAALQTLLKETEAPAM